MQHVSIKFRLSLVFYLFLFLVAFLGVFNLAALTDFNGVADQIRNRWLPSTRFLGDLNNYTSDFRAAEGTLLLASSPEDIAAGEREMDELDRNIAKAQQGYGQIYHDEKETDLFRHFLEDWKNYRNIVNQVLALMHADSKEKGIAIYKTSSKSAYNAASDTLGQLTDLDVVEDQEASDLAAAAYRQVRTLTVLAMLAAIFLVTVGVVYIRRSISTPMLNLAKDMHRLAGNDMDVDIQGSDRRDEIGEMARALTIFRKNAVDLLLSRQGLAQQASMLEEKLEHERELMDVQRNFISMASHEFRTPLNIIDGHAQRLAKTDNVAERAGKIRSAVKQMTGLIDNLINAARLFESNPELYFHPASIDLAALLREVCSQHREIISGTQIVETFDAEPLEMSGDPKLLAQMFGNLLSNAIKYSPSVGIIEVGAVRDSSHIMVTVRDHGIGIPQKDIEDIFERYSRGSNVSDISGTGIGLHLVKMIVKLHGGSITVESAEGKGAIFTVHLQEQFSKDLNHDYA
jgi:signal transduction histidine kinase